MPVLQPEDLAFLLRNTDYKEEEINEAFNVLDVDANGQISAANLSRVMSQQLGTKLGERKAHLMIEALLQSEDKEAVSGASAPTTAAGVATAAVAGSRAGSLARSSARLLELTRPKS